MARCGLDVCHLGGLARRRAFLHAGTGKDTFYKEKVPTLIKQLFVFGFVTFAWIFFKAASIGDAWVIVTRIFSSGWADPHCPMLVLALIFAVWLYQYTYESNIRWVLELKPVRVGLAVTMIIYLAVFAPSSDQAFIYMQF